MRMDTLAGSGHPTLYRVSPWAGDDILSGGAEFVAGLLYQSLGNRSIWFLLNVPNAAFVYRAGGNLSQGNCS